MKKVTYQEMKEITDGVTSPEANFLNSAWGTQDYTTTGVSTAKLDWYNPNTYIRCIDTTYYPFWTVGENKIEQSFRLVQKLIEKKVIKEPATVKDFIELINNIAEVI